MFHVQNMDFLKKKKKKSVAFLRGIAFFFFFSCKNSRGTTRACNLFFNTHFFPFTDWPLRYTNQPIRTRFACKQLASEDGRHQRRQHAKHRYVVVFFLHFALVITMCCYEQRDSALILFSPLKCIYCLYLSVTNIAFLLTRLSMKMLSIRFR